MTEGTGAAEPVGSRLARLSPAKRQLLARLVADSSSPQLIRAASPPRPEWEVTAGQRRTYLDHAADPLATFWNMRMAVRVRGPFDPRAYERAVRELARRHDTLRGSFVRRGAAIWQVLRTADTVPLVQDDIRGLDTAEQAAAVAGAVEREGRRAFDLGQDVPLRGRVLRAETEHIVLLTIHHIVLDGWSANVLLRQIDELYKAISAGHPLPPPGPLQFSDYASWQNDWLRSPDRLAATQFWRRELTGAQSHVALPGAAARSDAPGFERGFLPIMITADTADAARGLAAAARTTLYTVLVAALGLLLGRLAGTDDLIVAVPVASRPQQELEELIGLFANLVPLRLRLPASGGFAAAVEAAHATIRRSFAHQDLPIEELIRDGPVPEAPGYAPLCQLIFAMYNYPKYVSILAPNEVEAIETGPSEALQVYAPSRTRPDICVRVNDNGAARDLAGIVEYNSLVLPPAVAERIFASYPRLLRELVGAPSRPLEEIAALPAQAAR